MDKMTITVLMAVAALAGSITASAVPVVLVEDGLRTASGTYYVLVFNGSDGKPASTAIWDWDGATLRMTSGFLQANQHLADGIAVFSDRVTGLVIDTSTGVTTATSYRCLEGVFGSISFTNQCASTSYGTNIVNDTSIAYDVGGNAACEERAVGGDDTSSGGVYRGLRSWDGSGAPCGGTTNGNNTGRGALDMVLVVQNDLGTGGTLILANWNIAGTPPIACLSPGPAGTADPSQNLCARAHWLTLRLDTDGDGIADVADNCPMNANTNQLNTDGDGFGNACDPDDDNDTILDTADNCTLVGNNAPGTVPNSQGASKAQLDSDGDGYGNICDADINNSGLVTTTDYTRLRGVLNRLYDFSADSAAADLNGSGSVTTTDYTLLRNLLNTAPGPSGLVP